MSNDQLLGYINQARKSGKTDEEIKQELLGAGWQIADIDEGLKIPIVSQKSPKFNFIRNFIRKTAKIILGILVLIVFVLASYFVGPILGSTLGKYANNFSGKNLAPNQNLNPSLLSTSKLSTYDSMVALCSGDKTDYELKDHILPGSVNIAFKNITGGDLKKELVAGGYEDHLLEELVEFYDKGLDTVYHIEWTDDFLNKNQVDPAQLTDMLNNIMRKDYVSIKEFYDPTVDRGYEKPFLGLLIDDIKDCKNGICLDSPWGYERVGPYDAIKKPTAEGGYVYKNGYLIKITEINRFGFFDIYLNDRAGIPRLFEDFPDLSPHPSRNTIEEIQDVNKLMDKKMYVGIDVEVGYKIKPFIYLLQKIKTGLGWNYHWHGGNGPIGREITPLSSRQSYFDLHIPKEFDLEAIKRKLTGYLEIDTKKSFVEGGASIWIKIPPGQEGCWIRELEKNNIVEFVIPNIMMQAF